MTKQSRTRVDKKGDSKNPGFGNLLSIVFGSAISLIIAVAVFALIYNQKLAASSQLVEHRSYILTEAEQLLTSEKDLTSGGYTLTGDSSYLDNYLIARGEVLMRLQDLKGLTKGETNSQKLVDTLGEITRVRINLAEENIKWRNIEGFNADRRMVAVVQNRRLMAEVRESIAGIKEEQNQLLKESKSTWNVRQKRFNIIFSALIASIVLLLLLVFFTIRYNLLRRAAAEKDLKVSEERLFLALEGTTAGIWDWDIEADRRWWSKKYYALLGYNENEIIPSLDNLKKSLHPEDIERTFNLLNAHLQQQNRFELEYRLKTKSGEYKWFAGTGQARYNAAGKAVRMVGAIMDIDERKKAQQAIASQAALIQLLPDAVLYGQKEGFKITSLNEAAERLFGSSNNAKGKRVDELITYTLIGTNDAEVEQELWHGSGSWRGEIDFVTHNGVTMNFLANVKVLKDVTGDAYGWVAAYTDLSTLRLNEALKIANEYLEQLAFIGAHDIKSPIITLDELSKMLIESEAVKEEHQEVFNMLVGIIAQMKKSNNALNEILRLRETLRGVATGSETFASAVAVWEDVKMALLHEVENAKANIVVDLDGVDEVPVSYVHLRSIFHNLITNSLKYRSPARPAAIKITATQTGTGYVFTFSDNGIGMDLVLNKPKLFRIFKRFHSHVEGTGTGLHIVKSIVEGYGGKVEVRSKVDEGTTFEITFKKSSD